MKLGVRTLGICMLAFAGACSPTTGGPVDGPADDHCGSTVVTVDPALCSQPSTGATPDTVGVHDGTEADDDDCKYHVVWSSSAVGENQDVQFTVKLTSKADGTLVTGADPNLEVFLNDTHPAPNSNPLTSEPTPGTYDISPIRFNAKGRWTVRFHFFESCTDSATSPHGHGAFSVDVP